MFFCSRFHKKYLRKIFISQKNQNSFRKRDNVEIIIMYRQNNGCKKKVTHEKIQDNCTLQVIKYERDELVLIIIIKISAYSVMNKQEKMNVEPYLCLRGIVLHISRLLLCIHSVFK